MKNITLFSILFFAVHFTYADDTQLSYDIDNLAEKYFEMNRFNGALLVAKDDDILLEKAYGMANFEWNIENQIDYKFRIGSVTKPFTAVLVMQLIEQGKINLDDKINQHLSYYRKDTGKKITIEHLLRHTSGIPNLSSKDDWDKKTMKIDHGLDELVKTYCSDDLDFEPGTKFEYSNSNYLILGAIIEKLTNKTYAEVLQKGILKPAEMNNTGIDNHYEIIPSRVTGYTRVDDKLTHASYISMSNAISAGGIYSTVKDLHEFSKALNTNLLISEESKHIMYSPGEIKPGKMPTGWGYGYGWVTITKKLNHNQNEIKLVMHDGGIDGFSSNMIKVLDDNIFIAALHNLGEGGGPFRLSMEILNLIYQEPFIKLK